MAAKGTKPRGAAARPATAAKGPRLVSADRIRDRMSETFGAIARRAFEIFEAHGGRPGGDLNDWFQAERELLHPLEVEVSETADACIITAGVPGFAAKDLEVSLEPRRLTISGTRQAARTVKRARTVSSERTSATIYRVLPLPDDLDTASPDVKARCDKGRLTITVPKLGRPGTTRVRVRSRAGS